MHTIMYLIRHGATEANLAKPARLQGRRHDPPLARLGIRQAEMTRDFLAVRPIDQCFCSPLKRTMQTASIIAGPHEIAPQPLEGITECDVGVWEGLDWQTIRNDDPASYERFMTNPAEFGYPGGESFADVYERVSRMPGGLAGRVCRAVDAGGGPSRRESYLPGGLAGLDAGSGAAGGPRQLRHKRGDPRGGKDDDQHA